MYGAAGMSRQRATRSSDGTGCDGGSNTWDAASLWQDDTTWLVAAPWS